MPDVFFVCLHFPRIPPQLAARYVDVWLTL
jgi:hypothetical protein